MNCSRCGQPIGVDWERVYSSQSLDDAINDVPMKPDKGEVWVSPRFKCGCAPKDRPLVSWVDFGRMEQSGMKQWTSYFETELSGENPAHKESK